MPHMLILLALLAADPIGSALHPGTRLTYASGGTEQPPWVYAEVRAVERADFERCVLVRIEGQPARESCMREGVLFEALPEGGHRPARPIGPGLALDVTTASGNIVRYETGAEGSREIGGHTVAFVTTTVVTRSPAGQVTRRLREEYASSLLTALRGVFEEPDGAGGWTTTQEFTLTRIEQR